jgi:hypothetical protein
MIDFDGPATVARPRYGETVVLSRGVAMCGRQDSVCAGRLNIAVHAPSFEEEQPCR